MTIFKELKELVADFVESREWNDFHNPKNLSMSIAIEAAELMELFQWLTVEESKQQLKSNESLRAELEDELADVLIYCLSLANKTNINIERAVKEKMERNEQRFPIENNKHNFEKTS